MGCYFVYAIMDTIKYTRVCCDSGHNHVSEYDALKAFVDNFRDWLMVSNSILVDSWLTGNENDLITVMNKKLPYCESIDKLEEAWRHLSDVDVRFRFHIIDLMELMD